MSQQLETLIVERSGGVVTITMNRPARKNAANGTMWSELLTTFEDVAGDRNDRVMVLPGAGDAFCSGADLGAAANVAGRPGDPYMALGCDLVVASDTARFSQIFSKRGLSIDFGASWLLPRLIGLHRAKELAFFADILDAREAQEFGLVNRVVPRDELDAFVSEWATRLAAGPPLALSMTKTMLNNSMGLSMDQALEEESRSQAVNFGTADTMEAIAAFGEKREPRFEGR